MFVFIQKQYLENFAFLILRILKLFAREFSVLNPDSIFGDTVYSCYCKLRLVTPLHSTPPTHTHTMVGAEGTIIFYFDYPRSLEKALSGKELHRKLLLLSKKY